MLISLGIQFFIYQIFEIFVARPENIGSIGSLHSFDQFLLTHVLQVVQSVPAGAAWAPASWRLRMWRGPWSGPRPRLSGWAAVSVELPASGSGAAGASESGSGSDNGFYIKPLT